MPRSYSQQLKIKVKAAYRRIVLTRITFAFFVFSLLHCFAQGIINAFSFSIDSEYNDIVGGIINATHLPTHEIPDLTGATHQWVLRACTDIPYYGREESNCTVVVNMTASANSDTLPQTLSRSDLSHIHIFPASNASVLIPPLVPTGNQNSNAAITNDSSVPVILTFRNGTQAGLNQQCTKSLLYAQHEFHDLRREDATLVAIQFWIFFMSFIAVVYDSIPHTFAVFGARLLMTAWSSYNIWRNADTRSRFQQLYVNAGSPCQLDLGFSDYFATRGVYEIPDFILNCTALLISTYLSLTLLHMYKKQSFKCVGAPPEIHVLYKYFMAVLACMQLGAFVLISAISLWIDELRTVLLHMSDHTPVYLAAFIFTAIIVAPIGTIGWIAIKKEKKVLMAVFLILLFMLVVAWGAMFDSQIYRWTFMNWPLLAGLTVASFILIISCMILGVVCWLNFGKGLAHYLYVEDLLADQDFQPSVFSTKVDDDDDDTWLKKNKSVTEVTNENSGRFNLDLRSISANTMKDIELGSPVIDRSSLSKNKKVPRPLRLGVDPRSGSTVRVDIDITKSER